MREDPPRPANLAAGYDEDDPYEGEDLSTYPDWWRENIQEFRDHEMRPYRPPRFVDGEFVPPLLMDLEADLAVEIRLRTIDPAVGDNWVVTVDGETVTEVARTREGEGFTQYDVDAATIESVVRDAVE